jgi:hypothetical protein
MPRNQQNAGGSGPATPGCTSLHPPPPPRETLSSDSQILTSSPGGRIAVILSPNLSENTHTKKYWVVY